MELLTLQKIWGNSLVTPNRIFKVSLFHTEFLSRTEFLHIINFPI